MGKNTELQQTQYLSSRKQVIIQQSKVLCHYLQMFLKMVIIVDLEPNRDGDYRLVLSGKCTEVTKT